MKVGVVGVDVCVSSHFKEELNSAVDNGFELLVGREQIL